MKRILIPLIFCVPLAANNSTPPQSTQSTQSFEVDLGEGKSATVNVTYNVNNSNESANDTQATAKVAAQQTEEIRKLRKDYAFKNLMDALARLCEQIIAMRSKG